MGRTQTVWIVSHFEFLGPPYWLDELVGYVASTKSGALRYLKTVRVDPGTWWGIQPCPVDGPTETSPGRQMLYSRNGKRMKGGYTLKQALNLSRELRARNAARIRAWRRAKKKGGTKSPPSRPS
jgi:hypothetical protein